MQEMAKKRVVLTLPGMDRVPVRAGVEYAPGRTFDVHGAVGDGLANASGAPAVLFVSGYPDPAFAARMGCAFAAAALARNMPLTLANLPDAPHAFDLMDDRETSREAMRQLLSWLRVQLRA